MRFLRSIHRTPRPRSTIPTRTSTYFVPIILTVIVGGCSSSGSSAVTDRVFSPPELTRLSELLAEVPETPPSDCAEIIAGDRFAMYPENVRRLIRRDASQRGIPIAADSSFRFGFEEARRDVRQGVLVYHNVGSPSLFTDHRGDVWQREMVLEDLLLRDYGVRTIHWGEATTTSQWAYLCGYGYVFDSVASLFFGENVVTEAVLRVENEILLSGRKHKDRWLVQK